MAFSICLFVYYFIIISRNYDNVTVPLSVNKIESVVLYSQGTKSLSKRTLYTECPQKRRRVHNSLIYRRILTIYTPN
jgi:hypothetical protein